MKAIILAAGKGKRLTGKVPSAKCLVRIGGMSLLDRQIRTLRQCGMPEIVVVVGYQKDRVRQECGEGIQFVENPRYEETNSLYSLWLARRHLADGFVVLNSDVLFHPAMLCDLLAARHEAALLMAFRCDGDEAFGEEEMKVKVNGSLVTDISKDIDPDEADGENVGIAKFGPRQARHLLRYIERLVADGGSNDWVPRAFREFALHHPLHVVGTRDHPWIEIDFPEDYERAVRQVAPRITE